MSDFSHINSVVLEEFADQINKPIKDKEELFLELQCVASRYIYTEGDFNEHLQNLIDSWEGNLTDEFVYINTDLVCDYLSPYQDSSSNL